MVIKKTSIFLLLGAAIAIVTGVVIRDVCVYISGGRPWSATVDGLCSAFLCANRDCVLVKMPVCGNSMEFEAKHLWRGKYQFRLWVPEVVSNFTTVDEKVGLECAFYDMNGRRVFVIDTPPSPHKFWSQTGCGMQRGSDVAFRMYLVPDDVPLDHALMVKARLYGEIDKFRAVYPTSYLLLVKERDK